jgi:O-antigen ligase
VYFWGAAVSAAASALLLLVLPPRLPRAPRQRTLDTWLVACLLYAALQIVPFPASTVDAVSPASAAIVETLSLAPPGIARPISIDPRASLHASLVFGASLAVFWSVRAMFGVGRIRTVARGVAFWGLVAATIGILQNASGTRLVYWWWVPQSDGPPGFGPFINRNHFAGWAVMAIALTLGYLAARTHARDELDRYRSFAARLRRRLDARTIWLLGAVGTLLTGLVLTLSRSGLAAAVAAAAVARLAASASRAGARSWWWAVAGAAVVFAIFWTGPAMLLDRWQAADIGQSGRLVIWRETLPVVRDFLLTGAGVGTYGAVMTVYQSDRAVHFNQAHNHYLQVLAEGGLMLFGLVAGAAWAFLAAALERVRHDRSGMRWLRVGAAAGLAGIAVQSLWETPARMPANALLAAVLAAVVLHEPDGRPHPAPGGSDHA